MAGHPVTEETLLCGSPPQLLAVVSRPLARPCSATGTLLLNAGSIHRVGPNRLHVQLARRLAASGQLACRFDLGGIGDSVPEGGAQAAANGGQAFEHRAAEETRQVMDDLQRSFGIDRFVLFGLCSGADVACRASQADGRVIGLVLVNGHLCSYRQQARLFHRATAAATFRRYRRRLLAPGTWWEQLSAGGSVLGPLSRASILARRLLRRRSPSGPQPAGPPERNIEQPTLPLGGARTLLVYSDGSLAFDMFRLSLERQLNELPAATRPQVQIARNTDHIFSSLDAQENLCQLAVAHCWLVDENSGVFEAQQSLFGH